MPLKKSNYVDKFDLVHVDDIARLRKYDAAEKARATSAPTPEVTAGFSLWAACLLLFVAHLLAGLAIWLARKL